MFRMAYARGAQDALEKFALKLTPFNEHVLDLAGLGLIAAPVAHTLLSGDQGDSPEVSKLKHMSDLTGLSMLAVPTALKLLQRH